MNETEQILDVIQTEYEKILLASASKGLLLFGTTMLLDTIDLCKKAGKIPSKVYAHEAYIYMVIDTDRTFIQVIDVMIDGVHFKREWKIGSTETHKCHCQCHDEDDKETLVDALSRVINGEDMLVDLLESLKLGDFLKLKNLVCSICHTMED